MAIVTRYVGRFIYTYDTGDATVPSIRSEVTNTETANTSFTLNKAASSITGDEFLITLALDGSGHSLTTPTGFTSQVDAASGGDTSTSMSWCWTKTVDGTEAASVTFTTGANEAWAGRYLCVRDTGGVDVVAEDVSVANRTTATLPSVVVTDDNSLGILTVYCEDADTVITVPTGWTRYGSDVVAGTTETGEKLATFYREMEAGSTGTVTVTQSLSQEMILGLVVYKPIDSTPPTGSAALTQANQVIAATGAQLFTGSAALTQANQALAATGSETFTGSSAITQAGQTLAASGTVGSGLSGSAALTQANQALAASGTEQFSGSSALTQANQALAASGTERFTGSSALTQSNQALAASGTERFTGSAPIAQANQALSATGTERFSGSAAITQAAQVLAATGTNGFTGTATLIQSGNSLSASAALIFSGTAGLTQAPAQVSSTGALRFSASASLTQAPQVLAAAGAAQFIGTVSLTQQGNTLSAMGTIDNSVSGAAALQQMNQVFAAAGSIEFFISEDRVIIYAGDIGRIVGKAYALRVIKYDREH